MTSLSLLGFTNYSIADTSVPISATGGVRRDYQDPSNIVGLTVNLYKQFSGSLSRKDQSTHTKAIIIAAATLDNGQIAEWSNPENNTAGRIKVVLTKPVQGGFCRLLYTQVEKNGHVRDYTEYACKTIDSQFWSFSSR